MTIVRYKDGTEIREGQYVCAESIILGGLCTKPRKVTRVAGQRVYFERDGREKYMSKRCVVFVCDIESEGMGIFELGMARMLAGKRAVEEAQAKVHGEFEPQIAALLGGAQ